jgi:hypothetical protein
MSQTTARFTLNVVCNQKKISAPLKQKTFSLAQGSLTPLVILVPRFLAYPACGLDIKYSAAQADGSLLPSQVSFDD